MKTTKGPSPRAEYMQRYHLPRQLERARLRVEYLEKQAVRYNMAELLER